MSKADRRLQRHVDALLKDRRPPRADAGDDESAMLLAAQLHAAHPGSAEPSPEFVDELARRLRRQREESAAPAPSMQRRRFLATAGAAAAAGLGAGFGVERLREVLTGGAVPGGQPAIVPSDGAWVAVASLADMTPGAIRRFSAGGVEGFLLNAGGTLRALSAVCTDQGCVLRADAPRSQLVCPCHYATFGLDGTPTPGTAYAHAVTPLPTLSVRTSGGNVEVLVPKTV